MKRTTTITISVESIFNEACRRTLEVVKAVPAATTEQHGLSVDELEWAMYAFRKARAVAAKALYPLSREISGTKAEQVDDDTLIFRIMCDSPLQEGLLPEAIERFLSLWIAAAWFRLHPELNIEIDMEAELRELKRLTRRTGGLERPPQRY